MSTTTNRSEFCDCGYPDFPCAGDEHGESARCSKRKRKMMDEATLTALQGSIAKWEAIVKGTGIDYGTENCPLCELFYHQDNESLEDECTGCPVAEKVGRNCCLATPYEKWGVYMGDRDRELGSESRTAFDDESRKLAQTELDFLRSLLPKDNK